MELTATIAGRSVRWRSEVYHDLARGVRFDGSDATAFGLPRPVLTTIRGERFLGKVAEGGSVNCATVSVNPHNVTHVEGIGHLRSDGAAIAGILHRWLFPARVVTVRPETRPDGDRVITAARLAPRITPGDPFVEAIVLRTQRAGETAAAGEMTGPHPPYLAEEAARLLREAGTRLLAIDLPSLDREADGGAMRAHRAFLGDPDAPIEPERAVCELIEVPDAVADGPYLLLVLPLRWETDATPARPLLFPVEE